MEINENVWNESFELNGHDLSLTRFIQRGKPIRKVAALTPTFIHGVHLFLEMTDNIEYL